MKKQAMSHHSDWPEADMASALRSDWLLEGMTSCVEVPLEMLVDTASL